MACDYCGAPGRRCAGGCPGPCCNRGGGGSGKRGKAKGTDGREHKHNYQATRREVKVIKDRRKRYRVTYTFLECLTPHCPQPNKMDIHREEL